MPFTDEETRAWHAAKRAREYRSEPSDRPIQIAICLHCKNGFGIAEGVVTDEADFCDVCLGG